MKRPFDPAMPSDPADAAAAWLLRLVEDAPDAETQAAWRRWLDSAPECRSAFARAFDVWQALDSAEAAPWLAAMAREARADLQQRRLQRAPQRRRWIAAAAVIFLTTIVAGAGWWYATAPVTYATGIGERRVVQLADGSRISLDAATRVEVMYSRDHRRLRLLKGRLACNVARDPLRPFSVAAADKVVVATGTEFSVELVSDQVRVVLYQGHVAVLDADASAPVPEAVRLQGSAAAADAALLPGRELVVPAHRDGAVVSPVNPAQSLSWERGQLWFDNEPLALAVERVDRYARARIEVGDAAAARIRVSGVFTAGDTDAFISGVTSVFPLRAVIRNGDVVLESKPR